MKIRSSLLLFIAMNTFSYAIDKGTPDEETLFSLSISPPTLATIDSPSAESYLANRQHTENPQRFFNLDKTLEISVLQQFREQASNVFQNRKQYLREQKEFLELLLQKGKDQSNIRLQSLHPLFQNYLDITIINILEKNIQAYAESIEGINNILQEIIQEESMKIDSLFKKFTFNRLMTLASRDGRRKQRVNLPSTKKDDFNTLDGYDKFASLEAIMNFRIYDEILYALFPHISQGCFLASNELTHEKTAIKQDGALMQFLAGQVQIPFDPDTTWEMRTVKGKMGNIYNPDLGTYMHIVIPIISKESIKLYNSLYKSLEKKDTAAIDMSFIPSHIKQLEAQRQNNKKKKKDSIIGKERGKGEKKEDSSSQPEDSIAQNPSPVFIHREVDQIAPQPSTSTPSLPPSFGDAEDIETKQKPFKPLGGWSAKDQLRSEQAKNKFQHLLPTPSKESDLPIQFQPENPVSLTGGQYQTLQDILEEKSYSVTFDGVRDLLKAIGIKVDRNGGSHAHINTPGHNIKTLVDIHYGWTNKYGRGTMEALRQLMINLGLDKEENIIR